MNLPRERFRSSLVFLSLWFGLSIPLPVAGLPTSATADAGTTDAGVTVVATPNAGTVDVWRDNMLQTPLPKKGCFQANRPSATWQEVECVTPPPYPVVPAIGGNAFADLTAVVSGLIISATGSFPITSGVTSESDYSGNFEPRLKPLLASTQFKLVL